MHHTNSASHTVFQNVYLVHEILEELSNSTLQKKDLCRAALVSSIFRKPAQDIIWREVPSIWVLLKLLLHKFRQPRLGALVPRPNAKSWYISEELVTDDLELLLRFGSRIRVLHRAFDCWDPMIEPSVFVIIASALGSQLLFPNLRGLDIVLFAQRPSDMAVFPLLYSTSLESVRISMLDHRHRGPFPLATHFYRTDVDVHAHDPILFLRRLQNSKPLKHLEVDFPMNNASLKLALSLPGLTSLALRVSAPGSIDVDFLLSLSRLPHLENLSIGGDAKFSWGNTPHNLKLHLPTLNSLTLCTFVEDAAILFSSMSAPSLQQLQYHFVLPSSPDTHTYAWSNLLNGIKNLSPLIWKITIEPVDLSDTEVERRIVDFHQYYPGVPFGHIMAPLLQLKLRYFSCDFALFRSLCLRSLESVAHAWPDLKSLFLRCVSETVVLDTSALSFISNKFPNLEELELDINTANIRGPSLIRGSHGLKFLYLRLINWHETAEKITTLASLIDSVFPELVPSEDLEFTDLSGEIIESFVMGLQEARRRERNRLALVPNNSITDKSPSLDLNAPP